MASILIADDNEDQATLLSILFDIEGHQSNFVLNGQQAVEHVKEFAPEVVLLDINMPVLDGYAAAQAIRAAMCGRRQPVLIAVTAMGSYQHVTRAFRSGFDAHLVKPVDFEELNDMVRRQLERREKMLFK